MRILISWAYCEKCARTLFVSDMTNSRSNRQWRSFSEWSGSLFGLYRFRSSDPLDSIAVRESNRGWQSAGQIGLCPEEHLDVDGVAVFQVETGPQFLGRDDFDDIFSIVSSDGNDHCPLYFSVDDRSITLHSSVGTRLVRKSFYFDEPITVEFSSRTQVFFSYSEV